MSPEPSIVRRRTVYWEECVSKTWKINNPFGSDPSWTLDGCVRVVEDDGKILAELEISGYVVSYELTDTCFEVPYYVFTLEACFSNVVITDGIPVSFDIVIKGCIGVSGSIGIFEYELEECVKLYTHTIELFRAKMSDSGVSGGFLADTLLVPLPWIEKEVAS